MYDTFGGRAVVQEVFQDGNDKLILEALVNFFFMGEDCADQVRFTSRAIGVPALVGLASVQLLL